MSYWSSAVGKHSAVFSLMEMGLKSAGTPGMFSEECVILNLCLWALCQALRQETMPFELFSPGFVLFICINDLGRCFFFFFFFAQKGIQGYLWKHCGKYHMMANPKNTSKTISKEKKLFYLKKKPLKSREGLVILSICFHLYCILKHSNDHCIPKTVLCRRDGLQWHIVFLKGGMSRYGGMPLTLCTTGLLYCS